MHRLSLSWSMMKQAYGVLMKDKELMLFPFFSGICMTLILATFAVSLFAFEKSINDSQMWWAVMAALPFLYFLLYGVGIFFQAALIAGAFERMSGGDPTLGSALRAASRRIGAILKWAVVAGTVGLILDIIEERLGVIGSFIIGILGFTWTMGTFFVVPVLVMEQEDIRTSFRRSGDLLQETWGESVGGQIGFGLLAFVGALLVICFAAMLGTIVPLLSGLLIVFYILASLTFLPALQGVYVASMYFYATEEEAPEGFDEDLFMAAWSAR